MRGFSADSNADLGQNRKHEDLRDSIGAGRLKRRDVYKQSGVIYKQMEPCVCLASGQQQPMPTTLQLLQLEVRGVCALAPKHPCPHASGIV